MIFDIDKKSKLSTAIIDDRGNRLTYGDLTIFCDTLKRKIPERKLVFCLCKNTAPSLAGFLALYDNKDVALLLNASMEKGLLDNLYKIYKPEYIWCPSNMREVGETEIIEEYLGYVLYKTTNDTPALNPDLSLLLTTSGTTGSPKLVRHKYGNIEINAQNVANVFGWNTTERGICDLPMQYTMGLNVINSHLYAGATVLLLSNHLLSPLFWSFIKEQRGTNFTGVPYSYEILKKMKFTQMDLPYLKTMAEGGGKLSNSLFEYFSEYASYSGKRFIATFGTTETSARLAYLPAELATKKCASIGFAIPGGTIVLKDDQGKVVANSHVEGELCYQGPNVTMGYAESVEDLVKGDEFKGEYCTGDIAFRDEDGCYFIIGRKKRFLKLFGLRVSLDQCEKIVADGLFIDCACSGNDNRMFVYITEAGKEEQVKKLISIKTGLPLTSLTVKCVDEIYRNESGKINYRKLDNEYGIF